MITLQQTLFALLLLMKPSDEDVKIESINDRAARMSIIAEAVADASFDVVCKGDESIEQKKYCWPGSAEELSLVLLSKGWSETHFTKRIHEGKCYDNECDPVWKTYHNVKLNTTTKYVAYWRAKSPWQIHYQEFMTPSTWRSIKGADYRSTFLAAQGAAKILSFGRNRCGGWNADSQIERGMALYATGKKCTWSGTKNRMWLYKNLTTKSKDYQMLSEVLIKHGVKVNSSNLNSSLIAFGD